MANAVLNGPTRRLRSPEQAEQVGGCEKSFGEWLYRVQSCGSQWCDADDRQVHLKRLRNVYGSGYQVSEKATGTLGEGSGAVGGYLVPYEYAYGLMKDVAEDSIFWPRADVSQMTTKTLQLPYPDPGTANNVQQWSNFFAGLRMQWGSSPNFMKETEPGFAEVELNAGDLSGYLLGSNQITQDYAGLDAFIRKFATRAVSWWTDQAFFQGAGAGQPLGILNGPGSIKIVRNAAGAVAQVDVAKMFQGLLPSSTTRAIWAMSPTAMENIANLTGLGGLLYFIPGEDGSQGLLYGRPFYVTEKLPDLGTTGDVVLFDPALYCIGHRDLLIDYSDQWPQAFTQNQGVWRILWRGDGVPMLRTSVTLANQSATKAAAYVVLQ